MATFELIDTVFRAVRRGGSSNGKDFPVQQNEQNELLVAQGLPPYTEVTRAGAGWSVSTATAFAGVVALPTTLAKLEIKNNAVGRVMVVDTIWTYQLLGTAVVWAITPWAQVGTAVTSAVTALNVHSANGKASYASATGTDAVTAIDQTVTASGWRPFPGSSVAFGLAAATPGPVVIGEVGGRLVVPYGKALHVTVTSSVNTASALHCGASFFFAPATAE